MGRVCGRVVIILMTTYTGIRGSCVIPVMTIVATGGHMFSSQGPVSIVDGKGSRFPAGSSGMAVGTGLWYVGCLVRRILAGNIFGIVASVAGIRRCCVIAVMTGVAIHS